MESHPDHYHGYSHFQGIVGHAYVTKTIKKCYLDDS